MKRLSVPSWIAKDIALSSEILHLASPVVLGMASITAIGVTDTIMVGRLGAASLAAAGLAAMIVWAVHWMTRSVEISVQALAARRYGEGRPDQCGKVLDNALVLSLALSACCAVGLFFGGRGILSAMSSYGEVIDLADGYIKILSLALWSSATVFAMRGFFSGIGKTRVFFASAALMLTVNVVANYAFIFGKLGMPAMGVRGAAVGSLLAFAAAFVFMIGYILGWYGRNFRQEFGIFKISNIDVSAIQELARLAGPNALRGIMVIGGLLVFYAMVDKLDVVQVAVVNVVLNIQSISFMPGHGFGVAAATVISQNLGGKNPLRAEQAGYEALRLAMLFMGALGLVFLLVPEWVIRLFTTDSEVIGDAVFPLRLVGVVQTLDAAGMVFSSALEGAGNTRWVMAAEIAVNWGVFLPLTWLFTFSFGLGRYGPWMAWATYLTVFGIWCCLKYRKGEWKMIKI